MFHDAREEHDAKNLDDGMVAIALSLASYRRQVMMTELLAFVQVHDRAGFPGEAWCQVPTRTKRITFKAVETVPG